MEGRDQGARKEKGFGGGATDLAGSSKAVPRLREIAGENADARRSGPPLANARTSRLHCLGGWSDAEVGLRQTGDHRRFRGGQIAVTAYAGAVASVMASRAMAPKSVLCPGC